VATWVNELRKEGKSMIKRICYLIASFAFSLMLLIGLSFYVSSEAIAAQSTNITLDTIDDGLISEGDDSLHEAGIAVDADYTYTMPAEEWVVLPIIISASKPPAGTYWPTEGWRTSTPEEQGMVSTPIQQMFAAIDQQQLDVHSVLVVRNGYIVAEKYFQPYDQNSRHVIFSCTKSFISALIGITIDEGAIAGVDQPILDFFPDRTFANVDERKESMTLEHLLTMRSGLDWVEGVPAETEMEKTDNWVQYILDRPMAAEPGSEFHYCSGCSHLMSAIIQETTGTDTLAFAQSRLFEPLGITDVYWGLDVTGIANGGWGLEVTPRDMAKFGYLYLNEGVWDGKQIIPAEWFKTSTQQSVALREEMGYGYQWWIYPQMRIYAARGFQHQAIYVIPDLNVVVVFTAGIEDTTEDVLFDLVEEFALLAR
jgi:CubicO group peptidase (beta-lactamase class C family)